MNRFTKISVDGYSIEELEAVLREVYSADRLPSRVIEGMMEVVKYSTNQASSRKVNLRDLLRFAELYVGCDRNIPFAF